MILSAIAVKPLVYKLFFTYWFILKLSPRKKYVLKKPVLHLENRMKSSFPKIYWFILNILMAIFFPLFTLLEDVGFLPRIAFNLDKCFKKCHACGKQALTMCMGFGCNAVGVIGTRIIDSPRERLIAIITNNFVPCNGRFAPPYKWQQKYGSFKTGQ